jgi:hypothetical protein
MTAMRPAYSPSESPPAGGGEPEGVRAWLEPGPSRLAGRGAMAGGMEEEDTTEVKEDEDEWAERLGREQRCAAPVLEAMGQFWAAAWYLDWR